MPKPPTAWEITKPISEKMYLAGDITDDIKLCPTGYSFNQFKAKRRWDDFGFSTHASSMSVSCKSINMLQHVAGLA